MEMQQSVALYRHARASHDWVLMRMSHEAALELVAYLQTQLAAHPGAALLIQRGLGENGYETLWHSIEGLTYGENASHPCPPFGDCT